MALSATAANTGAKKNYNVKQVDALKYEGDDALTTKVYHGVSITAGDSQVIGRIQSWQPDSHTREGVHLYELANVSWGRPVEYVPGKATGYTIAVTRAEVWNAEMEKAFGFKNLFDDLMDQTKAFQVKEFWLKGSEIMQIWHYRGCWFQNKNMDAVTSDGDGVTRISATLAYVSRRLVAK